MKGIRIRQFAKNDILALKELIHFTVKKCYPACYVSEVIDFYLDYHSEKELLRKSEEGCILVATLDNKLVASGYLLGEELGGVYVHPEYQGQGVASHMMEALLALAVEKNLSSVWLESTPLALELYKKFGFVVEEERVMYVENNAPLPYYHMVKTRLEGVNSF